jgi:hypothetical protein
MSVGGRKFRNNGRELITATRPLFKKIKKPKVPREFCIVRGNSFRESINLYWIKRKKHKRKYETK